MHLDDVAEWLRVLECQAIVLIHVSRRTDVQYARNRIAEVAGAKVAEKVHVLMDYKSNRSRYEQQMLDAEAKEHAAHRSSQPAASESSTAS